MGRLLTIAIIVGTTAALLGGLTGAVLLAVAAPVPEHRVWFVWLCATLTGSVAAMATIVAVRVRSGRGNRRSNDLRRALASVLTGGCAGAVLALGMFGMSPRGRQLLFFAIGAAAGGCLFAVSRRLRRAEQRLADRRTPDTPYYSPSGTRFLPELHAASLPVPIVDVLLERRSRGRWFQFTLGSLLALTLISSVTLAIWVRGPIKRRQVIAAIERGGGGRVGYASRAPDWIVDLLGELARGIFDEVDSVELRNATDADLARLGFLSRLRSLSLAGNVTDEAMKRVSQWQSLEELDIGATNVSSKGLAELRRLPRLRTLSVPQSSDDAALTEVASLENLTTLWIDGGWPRSPSPVTAAGFDRLSSLRELRELRLNRLTIGDDEIAFISGLRRLTRLSLYDTRVSDAGLRHLVGLQELEWLDLTRTQVTGRGFKELSTLSRLRTLNLGGSPVTDRGLEAIAVLTSLETLSLDSTKITDAGLVHLKAMSKLHWLSIMSTAISDAGLPSLEELSNIGAFHRDGTNTTRGGIARLEAAWKERRDRLQPAD
jgi:Leucine-rich repeat (LRR) protein